MRCRHKTFVDHTATGKAPDGRTIWICSRCGSFGVWTDEWSYYGTIECRVCQLAAMEWVACSRECAAALNGDRVPRKSQPRQPRKPRAPRMSMRDKAAAYDRLVAAGQIKDAP